MRAADVMTTEVIPSLVVERSSSIPEMVLTASSIILVTPVSISSTLVPERVVVTVTMGRSTLGKRSTPSRRYEASPSTSGAETSMTVKIGRRTQSSQILDTRTLSSCHSERSEESRTLRRSRPFAALRVTVTLSDGLTIRPTITAQSPISTRLASRPPSSGSTRSASMATDT